MPLDHTDQQKAVERRETFEQGRTEAKRGEAEHSAYFEKVEIVIGKDGLSSNFRPNPQGVELGEKQHEFYARLKRAIFYVNACMKSLPEDEREKFRTSYGAWLRQIAQAPRPECGLLKIATFEKEFEHELKKLRDHYAISATICWGAFLACSLAATSLLFVANVAWAEPSPQGPLTFLGALWPGADPAPVLGGWFLEDLDLRETMRYVFITVWGSVGLAIGEMFTARYDSMSPQYATFFNEPRFRFRPSQRITFVSLTWIILVFLLAHGWFDLALGSVQLSAVEQHPWSAVVLGIMTSIGFQGILTGIVARFRRKEE